MHDRGTNTSAICLAALITAACGGGSGEGLDANGRPIGESGDGDGTLQPTLASIQQNVFTPVCTACHAGGTAPEGLRLDAGSSAAALIGVPSNQAPSVLRVAPGDPDASYLIRKLEGSAVAGARMPLGGPFLDEATIDVIRAWINAGAPATRGQP
jgi:hypothetical protein